MSRLWPLGEDTEWTLEHNLSKSVESSILRSLELYHTYYGYHGAHIYMPLYLLPKLPP